MDSGFSSHRPHIWETSSHYGRGTSTWNAILVRLKTSCHRTGMALQAYVKDILIEEWPKGGLSTYHTRTYIHTHTRRGRDREGRTAVCACNVYIHPNKCIQNTY
jgi:hypothetical protein